MKAEVEEEPSWSKAGYMININTGTERGHCNRQPAMANHALGCWFPLFCHFTVNSTSLRGERRFGLILDI